MLENLKDTSTIRSSKNLVYVTIGNQQVDSNIDTPKYSINL